MKDNFAFEKKVRKELLLTAVFIRTGKYHHIEVIERFIRWQEIREIMVGFPKIHSLDSN